MDSKYADKGNAKGDGEVMMARMISSLDEIRARNEAAFEQLRTDLRRFFWRWPLMFAGICSFIIVLVKYAFHLGGG